MFLLPLLPILVTGIILPYLQPSILWVLLLDTSGSMAEPFGIQNSKLESAQNTLNEVIQEMPEKLDVVLARFSDGNCGGNAGLQWIEQQPLSNLGGEILGRFHDKYSLTTSILNLTPKGQTHLSEALWKTLDYLSKLKNCPDNIIFILNSDGSDDYGGIHLDETPLSLFQSINLELNIYDYKRFSFYIIGLDHMEENRDRLENLLMNINGNYYSVDDRRTLQKIALDIAKPTDDKLIFGITLFVIIIPLVAVIIKKFKLN